MEFANPASVALHYRPLKCGQGNERVSILMGRLSGGRFEPAHATLYRIEQGTPANHTIFPTLGHVVVFGSSAYLHAKKHGMEHAEAHVHLVGVLFGAVGHPFEESFRQIVDDFSYIRAIRDVEAYIESKMDAWIPAKDTRVNMRIPEKLRT